jgi:hypothetical protein
MSRKWGEIYSNCGAKTFRQQPPHCYNWVCALKIQQLYKGNRGFKVPHLAISDAKILLRDHWI